MTPTHPPLALLNVKNLSYAYSHRKIFKKVGFDLYRSEIVVLQGPNGAGKTTLFKVLCGLLKKLTGDITLAPGFLGTGLYLPDSFLYEDLTVRENLNLYARLLGCPASKQHDLAFQFNLTDFYDERVRFLSRGQRVRGTLCCTFLSKADLFVLDEPFAGLDAVSVKKLLEVLTALREQGKTILMSTHSIEEVGPITDRWMEINKGSLRVLPGQS